MCWIRAGGGCIRAGETLNYLDRGWNRKEGKRNKDFKKGGSGSRGV